MIFMKDHLVDIREDGRTVSRRILEKKVPRVKNGSVCLRIGSWVGLL